MDEEENYGDEGKERDLRKRRGAKEKERSRSRDRSSQPYKKVKTREDEEKSREGGMKKTSETLQKLNISQPLDSGTAASLHDGQIQSGNIYFIVFQRFLVSKIEISFRYKRIILKIEISFLV